MNSRKTLDMKELLDLDDSVSEIEMQDIIRHVVPRSKVHFTNGVLKTPTQGVACLCNAILAGRVKGNLSVARKILDEIRLTHPEFEVVMSLEATRKLCLKVIEGRIDGDPERARALLVWLDQEHPPRS